MATSNKELSILIPEVSLTLSVGDVILKPFKFKQMGQVLPLVEKYSNVLFAGKEIEIDGQKVLVDKSTAEIIKDLLGKSDQGYEILNDVQVLISMVSPELTPDLFDELGYDDVFFVLSEIVEKNRDFFRRLAEKVNPTPQKVEPATQKAGQPESAA